MGPSKYIIHLHGIKRDDYINVEDVFDERLRECAELTIPEDTLDIVYKTIPHTFTNMDNWITDTNIKCWHCDFTFMSRPVFIPTHMQDDFMIVHGNFCSFSCASAYIGSTSTVPPGCMNNLLSLYKIFNDIDVLYIQPSPPRYAMKKYGGYMDEDKYLSQITLLEDNISTITEMYTREYNEHVIEDDDDSVASGIKAWDI